MDIRRLINAVRGWGRSSVVGHPSSLVALTALLLATLACNTFFPPRPAIEWNTAPEAIVIEVHTGGGMLYEPNATLDARLWGDGRLIWTNYDGSGRRELFTTTLSTTEMTAVLKEFVDAGFFGWKDLYSPGLVYDAPSSCMRVELASASYSVCEVLEGAPEQFWPLYSRLTSGAGGLAVPFVPERAYLSLTFSGPTTPILAWPTGTTPTLAEVSAAGGAWIEGEALALAWEAVNSAPFDPIFQEGDTYYSAQLLVPGVTVMTPP